jgi:hypothetical protein
MMKRLALACAIALALPGCHPDGSTVHSASNVVAKGVTVANDFYRAASRAGEDLVKAGLLDKAAYQKADAKAFAVLVDVRAGRATFAMLVDATAPLTGAKQ